VLLGIQPGLGPKTQRYGRAALAALEGSDVDLATRINLLAALNNYLLGFIHREVAWEQLHARSGLTEQQWTERLRRYLEATDATVAEQAAARLQLTSDESFQLGLECFLDGVAARLGRS
jgi:hypothetical protein